MASFIQFRRSRRASTSSIYMQLLSSLATDLDNMLSELCTTPPPPYDRLSDNELHNRTLRNKDGSGYASKNYGSHGLEPDQFGGRLDYYPTTINLCDNHTRHFGTDVNAGLNHNLYQNKNFGVDAVGSYGRHYGGPGEAGSPNGYVGVQGHADFLDWLE